MKKYTFSYQQRQLFVTHAETDEEALANAKAENAFDGIETEPKNRYFTVPAITVIVEEIEVEHSSTVSNQTDNKREEEECREEIKMH